MKKNKYDPVEIEIIYLEFHDIITASEVLGIDGEDGDEGTWDKGGWT